MEVSVDRDAFLKGLQMVHNVVEPRQTLPILANVLLESDGDTLRLTATDLEVGARVSVPAKVVSIPVAVDDMFAATGKRTELTKATGTVRFENRDPTSTNLASYAATNSGVDNNVDVIRIDVAWGEPGHGASAYFGVSLKATRQRQRVR